jgi:hypothetical protein
MRKDFDMDFKVGQKVVVKKHKCGTDTIGPFEAEIEYIDRLEDVAELTDPQGNDWSVRLSKLRPVEE